MTNVVYTLYGVKESGVLILYSEEVDPEKVSKKDWLHSVVKRIFNAKS